MSQTVTVRVPGSTSNIGPGFDCLGIALALHNRVSASRRASDAREHPAAVPDHAMVAGTAAAFFARAGVEPFGIDWTIAGDVPVSRGLGSSVTLRLGILAAMNELAGRPLDRQALFEVCTALEGHPDNAGPATFGGFVLAAPGGQMFQFDVAPELRFALLVPRFEVLTEPARAVLPASVPHHDAVRNVAHAATVAAAFATGEYAKLRGAFEDHLHQPFRQHLVPGMAEAIAAGIEAGALGGFLSGSGSTIACVVLDPVDAGAVAAAMQAAHPAFADARTLAVAADNRGARIEQDDPGAPPAPETTEDAT